jgi:hypothetical protein
VEKTFSEIEAEIASLRKSIDKYRSLAEERMAIGRHQIAGKLTELVADLEMKAEELEAFVRSHRMAC